MGHKKTGKVVRHIGKKSTGHKKGTGNKKK